MYLKLFMHGIYSQRLSHWRYQLLMFEKLNCSYKCSLRPILQYLAVQSNQIQFIESSVCNLFSSISSNFNIAINFVNHKNWQFIWLALATKMFQRVFCSHCISKYWNFSMCAMRTKPSIAYCLFATSHLWLNGFEWTSWNFLHIYRWENEKKRWKEMKYGSLYRRAECDSCMVKHTKSNANSDQKRCGAQKHTNHYMIVPMMVLSIQSCVQNMCIYYDKVLLMSFVHTCHFSRSEFIERMLLLCRLSREWACEW